MSGQELYELSRKVAPDFGVELKPWFDLNSQERQEWEVMAYERELADRGSNDD